jgi:hypothetical protein
VLEGDVQEGGLGFRERRVAVEKVAADVNPPAARGLDPHPHEQLRIDGDRPAIAHEHPRRHGREAKPGREQPARLVERRGDEAAVDEPRPGLMALVEMDVGLVQLRALLLGCGQVEAERVVAAAEARRIVMRRNDRRVYLSPPRSWCALKNSREPAVAIAAEAEISSASVAAATIWAKRYTFPAPAQPSMESHERA